MPSASRSRTCSPRGIADSACGTRTGTPSSFSYALKTSSGGATSSARQPRLRRSASSTSGRAGTRPRATSRFDAESSTPRTVLPSTTWTTRLFDKHIISASTSTRRFAATASADSIVGAIFGRADCDVNYGNVAAVLPADLSAFPVLVVDDEPDNLDAFRFNFKRVFQIHTAGSGDEALALLKEHDVAVIVTDQRMPKMTGLEFLKAARARAARRGRHHPDRVHRRRRADRVDQPRARLSLHHQAVGRQGSEGRAHAGDRALPPAARERAARSRSSRSTPAT